MHAEYIFDLNLWHTIAYFKNAYPDRPFPKLSWIFVGPQAPSASRPTCKWRYERVMGVSWVVQMSNVKISPSVLAKQTSLPTTLLENGFLHGYFFVEHQWFLDDSGWEVEEYILWGCCCIFQRTRPQKSVWLLRFQQNNTWPLNFLKYAPCISHLFVIYISMSSPTRRKNPLWMAVCAIGPHACQSCFISSKPTASWTSGTKTHHLPLKVPPKNNPKAQQKKHVLTPFKPGFSSLNQISWFQILQHNEQLVEVGRSHAFGRSFAASQIGALHTTAFAGPIGQRVDISAFGVLERCLWSKAFE